MPSLIYKKAQKFFSQLNDEERFAILIDLLDNPEILEDIEDIIAAKEARAEGGKTMSFEDFKNELREEGLL